VQLIGQDHVLVRQHGQHVRKGSRPWPGSIENRDGVRPKAGAVAFPLQLTQAGAALALAVAQRSTVEPETPPTPIERVRQTLTQLQEPILIQQLQKLCGIRTATVCSALAELSGKGEVIRDARGCQLKLSFPVSRPIDPIGNGNWKRPSPTQT
jgi:hypothetical protein